MKIIKFYNREKEIELLERVEKPFLAIIYGRRRIGKTTLALKFARDKDFIYFFVNPKKPENLLLEEFTSILKEKLSLPEYVRPTNWEEFFELLFKNYDGYVIFDEFQWFLEINKEVPFILQKYWDVHKGASIILTGSIIGMIKKLFIEEGSPLFKRAEITINLQEFDIKTVFEVLSDLGFKNLEEKFEFYLLFGGVPYYYHLLKKYRISSVEEAIKILVLDENAPLRNEVEEVMIEAFKREYKTYLAILYAIADGKTKLAEIASCAGIKTTSLMPYIYDLMNLLGIIEKQRMGLGKKHIYLVKDKFHNFWLRYIYKYSGILDEEELFEKIRADINNFFGWSFEVAVRENIKKVFPEFKTYTKYCGYLRRKGKRKVFDIDILAINEKTKEVLFAECKWQSKVNAKKIAKELAEKSQYVQWHNEERKEYFAIFAKSFKEKIEEFEGRKVYCFDLKDLERFMK